jgi:hypothetical protein
LSHRAAVLLPMMFAALMWALVMRQSEALVHAVLLTMF